MHQSVLLQEVITYLDMKSGDAVLDGTVNGGGHSKAICSHLGKEGRLIGIDQDKDALERATKALSQCNAPHFLIQENFRNLDLVLQGIGMKTVDKILLDLGFSSFQIETSGRGFSFQKDEPLLMTLKVSPKPEDLTAEEIVNTWEEEHIADIIYGFGEERFSRRIAKGIVEARAKKHITTTGELSQIIMESVPARYRSGKIHPATKTFQALRITVNDELGALTEGLEKGIRALSPGGRMAVISFHSLEDRIVKNIFRQKQKEGIVSILTKKPLVPSREEIKENKRARSAKLRVIEKL
ncbi:MAG: 16S rRNA (cytosine(1402)-N(4))-methyltransferase RsmH [Candidatus Yonathbacteria bacterium]|nr:16S rRNA (cytosine(1402)-N(4))-methyltransferase RsmH [Candidatus Yonathbacteria bacterium]